jgi:hypothetical protein
MLAFGNKVGYAFKTAEENPARIAWRNAELTQAIHERLFAFQHQEVGKP